MTPIKFNVIASYHNPVTGLCAVLARNLPRTSVFWLQHSHADQPVVVHGLCSKVRIRVRVRVRARVRVRVGLELGFARPGSGTGVA